MTIAPPRELHGLTDEEYRRILELLGREPNDVELGMFGAMWSEHCSYKNSRALLRELPSTGPRVVVGPGENAGAIDIGNGTAVVFKVESHNHPSAVEPYQGAATGVGGIVRDIFAMGARPIALLNSLRFGPLDADAAGAAAERPTDAAAAARNRYLFGGVVAGIAGYGNCIGIPDVGGEIFFDASYSGNPLVNAMCVGLVETERLMLASSAAAGNALLLVGASTGRDGIQGASFASSELGEASHERRPAVQVGNPFLEKLLMEACLELGPADGVVAVQDLGAAGLTCALAEVSARSGLGCDVDLDAVPRRERAMSPYEVLLSESQERMLLAVEPARVRDVQRRFERYELHAAVIGTVIDAPVVRCRSAGEIVCELPPHTLTDDAPRYVRERPAPALDATSPSRETLAPLAGERPTHDLMVQLLASANVRSRRPIWRRYDHMNGINTVAGPGAADAAVLRVKGTSRAIALTLDSSGRVGALDPRVGGAWAVVEGAVNVACTGAVPIGITDCLNFGSPETPDGYRELAEGISGIAAACRALDIPVVSGNVSLYNETPEGRILPTPVVGTVGLLEDRSAALGMAWHAGDEIWLLGDAPESAEAGLAGSEFAVMRGAATGSPAIDLDAAARLIRLLPALATARTIRCAHDVSTGGLGVALAEMAIASRLGATIALPSSGNSTEEAPGIAWFSETPGRVVVTAHAAEAEVLVRAAREHGVPAVRIGTVNDGEALDLGGLPLRVSELREAYETPF